MGGAFPFTGPLRVAVIFNVYDVWRFPVYGTASSSCDLLCPEATGVDALRPGFDATPLLGQDFGATLRFGPKALSRLRDRFE
jgi:hypothetical protein